MWDSSDFFMYSAGLIGKTFINPPLFLIPMGRIKTRKVKSITQDLLEEYEGCFSTDFAENKKKVSELTNTESKKLRNIIAGYVTRIVKSESNK